MPELRTELTVHSSVPVAVFMNIQYCTMWDISWLRELLLASQKRLCSVRLVSYLKQMIWARSVGRNMRIHKRLRLEVTQLVEALLCKPGGRRFDSRGCHLNFSPT